MLTIIFDKPRYRVRAVGGLVTVLGINFAIIENGPLARTVMIVGALLMVGGLSVELLALAKLAFNSSIRAFHNLHSYFVQAGERWAKEAEEREQQYQLTAAAAAAASKNETQNVASPTTQTSNAVIYYSQPFKASRTKKKSTSRFRGGSVSVRAHTRRLPRRRR